MLVKFHAVPLLKQINFYINNVKYKFNLCIGIRKSLPVWDNWMKCEWWAALCRLKQRKRVDLSYLTYLHLSIIKRLICTVYIYAHMYTHTIMKLCMIICRGYTLYSVHTLSDPSIILSALMLPSISFQINDLYMSLLNHGKVEDSNYNERLLSFKTHEKKVKVLFTPLYLILWPHGPQPTRFFHPWNSPGKTTGVSNLFLIQGIFSTLGWNPGTLQSVYHLSYHRSPQDTWKWSES